MRIHEYIELNKWIKLKYLLNIDSDCMYKIIEKAKEKEKEILIKINIMKQYLKYKNENYRRIRSNLLMKKYSC